MRGSLAQMRALVYVRFDIYEPLRALPSSLSISALTEALHSALAELLLGADRVGSHAGTRSWRHTGRAEMLICTRTS